MGDWNLPYLCTVELTNGSYNPLKQNIMISKKMIDDINAQINAEMWAAQLYLAMSIDAWRMGCRGMNHWLRKQHEEELQHAYKFIDYLESRHVEAELADITDVPKKWKSPKEMFEQALEHERKITQRIDALCREAMSEGDYATFHFLQYFVGEQVEEEASATEIVDTLKCFGDDIAALYAYDTSLLARE